MDMQSHKKKILWVSHMVPYPPKAGLLIRSFNLIKELSEFCDIDLIALNQKNLLEPYFESFEKGISESEKALRKYCKNLTIHKEPITTSPLKKISMVLLSQFSKYPYSVLWLRSRNFQSILQKTLSEEKYDLIYWDSIGLIEYFDNSIKGTTPQALGHHNIESAMMKRRSKLEQSKIMSMIYATEGKKLEELEKHVDSKICGHITCSDDDKKTLKNIGIKQSIKTIPNGFDFSLSENMQRSPIPYRILFIGTMDWYPNIDAVRQILSDIYPLLIQEDLDFRIDIIGANPPDELIELSQNLDNAHIHGFVDNLNPYITSANIYLCPIRDGGGTKLKMIEAFAYKIPVIAHPAACEGLNTQDKEHVFLANSPEEYIDAIKAIATSETTAKKLVDNAYRHAHTLFSFKTIAKNFDSVIADITGQR
ncbi:MAG: glycosyltransferase family 4 protein [Cellvibrionaceae bacterium]